ncbi:hypothetical protein GCM10011575_48250 [Microlunatus endophyticus]|uniref:Uncharacterized protein n=1 Tax=Microlunatus endophyticus TaxID=1716077 RepID=A0A917SIN2_9ACTN|nr:hypothetical protein GCM10011575_48250 [Microlunatus endophyticus]
MPAAPGGRLFDLDYLILGELVVVRILFLSLAVTLMLLVLNNWRLQHHSH